MCFYPIRAGVVARAWASDQALFSSRMASGPYIMVHESRHHDTMGDRERIRILPTFTMFTTFTGPSTLHHPPMR